MNTNGLKLRKEALSNRITLMNLQGLTLHLVEAIPSGIRQLNANSDELNQELTLILNHDPEGYWRKFERWLIGLNWKALLSI